MRISLSLFILVITTTAFCREEKQAFVGTDPRVLARELDEQKTQLAAWAAENRSLENASATGEAAVQHFLNSAAQGRTTGLCDETEYLRIYYANLTPHYNLRPGQKPADSWKMENELRGIVVPQFHSAFRGRNVKLESISWKKPPQNYGRIRLHFPGRLSVRVDGRPDHLGIVRTILEVDGRFKVLSVGGGD